MHQHQSFATPYASIQKQHQRSASGAGAVNSPFSSGKDPASSFIVPTLRTDAFSQILRKRDEPSSAIIGHTGALNARSELSPSNTSSSTFPYSSPATSVLNEIDHHQHFGHSQFRAHPYTLAHSHGHDHLNSHHASHTYPQSHLPPPSPSISSEGRPQSFRNSQIYRCEWSTCAQTFEHREQLIGHVNAIHLMRAEPAAPRPTSNSQPLFAETCNQAHHMIGQHKPNDSTGTAAASFEHTLKCLWDSCEASLPITSTETPIEASVPSSLVQSPAVLHSLPDSTAISGAPTATLVRHLLHDHLNLPNDVLGQFSPSLQHAITLHAQQHGPSDATYSTWGKESTSFEANSITHASSFPGMRVPTPTSSELGGKDLHPKAHSRVSSTSSMTAPSFTYDSSVTEASIPTLIDEPTYFPALTTSPENHVCAWISCSLSFPSTSALMDHISSVHIGSGQSTYYCQWSGCERAKEGRGFNQRQKIVRHVRTHVGDRPFMCTRCGRGFSESTTLAQVRSS